MSSTDELLEAIRTALDPERFFEQLDESAAGRSFLAGESDSVTLTRSFLDGEAEIARHALEALEQIRRILAVL
ncbi:MAG: hypothetical protein BMS9Abin07_1333 [Acidimicrobiia bacterium]|nr:MAG: hypothetical protein BMS9Abin07_1333 [Acidimicrobiia bacterium]